MINLLEVRNKFLGLMRDLNKRMERLEECETTDSRMLNQAELSEVEKYPINYDFDISESVDFFMKLKKKREHEEEIDKIENDDSLYFKAEITYLGIKGYMNWKIEIKMDILIINYEWFYNRDKFNSYQYKGV